MIWKYEYEIVETKWNQTTYYLKDGVQSLINEGWIPEGGMVQEQIEHHEEDNSVWHEYKYSQAMLKKQFILMYWLKKLFIRIAKVVKPKSKGD